MIFTKNAIRRFPGHSKSLFLTFDDGPSANTIAILDLLEKHQAKATFFFIANEAEKQKPVVSEILDRSHTIGNHSLDHSYAVFFRSRRVLRDWISDAEKKLADISGKKTVGFRPPAGVCTPDLNVVLQELQMPLILWNKRFFDTQFRWTKNRAQKSLDAYSPGDIVLLHEGKNDPRFLHTLDFYLSTARHRGLIPDAIGGRGLTKIRIEKSDIAEIPMLNEIISKSKKYWNYDTEYLKAALPLIQITDEWLARHDGYSIYDQGQLHGFLGIVPIENEWKLEHLWIEPSRIRTGLGTQAISYIMEKARDHEIKNIYLLPDPPSEEFYLKLGARFTGKEVQSRVPNGPLFREMKFTILL